MFWGARAEGEAVERARARVEQGRLLSGVENSKPTASGINLGSDLESQKTSNQTSDFDPVLGHEISYSGSG